MNRGQLITDERDDVGRFPLDNNPDRKQEAGEGNIRTFPQTSMNVMSQDGQEGRSAGRLHVRSRSSEMGGGFISCSISLPCISH